MNIMNKRLCLLRVFFLLSLACTTIGFNADLTNVKVFSLGTGTSNNDYFGYSLALHNNDQGDWLLVGAPLSAEGQTASEKFPGNLFKCPVGTSGSCNRIPIDKPEYAQNRSLQWLGATVVSSGPNFDVVTCAPRFRDETSFYVWLHGRCALLEGKTFAVKKLINPWVNERIGNLHFGYCESGLGAAITGKNGPLLVTGLPGYGEAKGRLALINIKASSSKFVLTSTDRLDKGDYMGYAVAWGNFSGSTLGDVVGGAPRANDLKGKVIIYKGVEVLPIIGVFDNPESQTGSYFGATLCAVDLDKNGFSDLLVGAPLYSVDFEEGKVYLYMNNGQGALNLVSPYIASEKRTGARFGSSIVALGDLNGDGYQDVAVGAPFGGDGSGAVYIYHGGPDGLKNDFKPIQVILASSIPGKPTAFGISITGGVDVDKNGYPDFAVGSYISERAHLFRSKGILKVVGTLDLNTTKVAISTNKSQCLGPDGKSYTCIKMDACLSFSGKGVPSDINASVIITLDGNQAGEKRAFFFIAGANRQTRASVVLLLTKGIKKCQSYIVYTASDFVKDLLSPIVVNMQYSYVQPLNCAGNLCPVMDRYMPKSISTQILYLKGCGSDDVCNSDLALQATYKLPKGVTELVFGVVDTFIIEATVENKKENAFLAKLLIDFPTDLVAVGAEPVGGGTLFWDVDPKVNRMSITLGSPFQGGRKLQLIIKFAPSKPRPTVKVQKFVLKATTVSKDINENNNIVRLQVNSALLADVTVTGSATPDAIYYGKSPAKEQSQVKTVADIGPEVKYTFLVQNKGPSPVEKLRVRVSVTTMEKKKYLLYLLDANIDGTTACSVTVNPLNLTTQIGPSKNESRPNRRRRSVDRLDCRTAICTSFDCLIGRLKKSDSVTLKLTTRVWESTLKQREQGTVDLVVKAVIEVPKEEMQYLRQPTNDEPDLKEVVIRVSPPTPSKSSSKKKIPWWIILLAVLGGLLLLAIPTAIMYKKGFFNRDRPVKDISGPEGGAQEVE